MIFVNAQGSKELKTTSKKEYLDVGFEMGRYSLRVIIIIQTPEVT